MSELKKENQKNDTFITNIICTEHKKYSGKAAPRSSCRQCWKIFVLTNSTDTVVNRLVDFSKNIFYGKVYVQ